MCRIAITNIYSLITIVGIGMLIFFSCKSEINTITPVPVNVKIDHLWSNIIQDTTKNKKIKETAGRDSVLARLVSAVILGSENGINDSLLNIYINDKARKKLDDTCNLVFSKFEWNKKLNAPLGRYIASFSDKKIPVIYPMITDFNYSIILFQNQSGDDALIIGKEMFLGDTRLYDQISIANPNFSSYINRTFNIAHLPEKIMSALASELVISPPTNRLIDHILAEGKKLYLVKQWIPELDDSIWFEVNTMQMQWIKNNELDIWRFLLSDKLLYKNSGRDIANLSQPAPHSQGMPPEAPGRAVNYIGFKIIESYMKNTKANLRDLVDQKNYDKILEDARYRPRE